MSPSCCSYTSSPPPSGIPSGTLTTIPSTSIEIYTALPASTSTSPSTSTSSEEPFPRTILFLHEAHGIRHPHAQLLADHLASRLNCRVVAPDLLSGGSMPVAAPEGWDDEVEMEGFKRKYVPATVDPILEKVTTWLSDASCSAENLGAIGYCFGGRYVLRLLAKGKVAVGVVNHPSFTILKEWDAVVTAPRIIFGEVRVGDRGEEGGNVNEQTQIKTPLAIFAAAEDPYFPKEMRREVEDRLENGGVEWMSTVYAGVKHGFTIRPDLGAEAGRFAWASATSGAVEWFDRYLPRRTSVPQNC